MKEDRLSIKHGKKTLKLWWSFRKCKWKPYTWNWYVSKSRKQVRGAHGAPEEWESGSSLNSLSSCKDRQHRAFWLTKRSKQENPIITVGCVYKFVWFYCIAYRKRKVFLKNNPKLPVFHRLPSGQTHFTSSVFFLKYRIMKIFIDVLYLLLS